MAHRRRELGELGGPRGSAHPLHSSIPIALVLFLTFREFAEHGVGHRRRELRLGGDEEGSISDSFSGSAKCSLELSLRF